MTNLPNIPKHLHYIGAYREYRVQCTRYSRYTLRGRVHEIHLPYHLVISDARYYQEKQEMFFRYYDYWIGIELLNFFCNFAVPFTKSGMK